MRTELIELTLADNDIAELTEIHNTLSVAKYISVSEKYFDYVTGTKGVVYYKIVTDNVLTGGIHCEFVEEIMYLSICVREEYRRRGIAETALRYLFSELPDKVKTIEVSIDETNIESQLLFQKLGFTNSGKNDELIIYSMSIR